MNHFSPLRDDRHRLLAPRAQRPHLRRRLLPEGGKVRAYLPHGDDPHGSHVMHVFRRDEDEDGVEALSSGKLELLTPQEGGGGGLFHQQRSMMARSDSSRPHHFSCDKRSHLPTRGSLPSVKVRITCTS